ncbi:MAG: HAD-IA family hydrolase [Cellulomonas sp.]|uniref:HAD family hydrolase n=1 Tax=Cellulomonas sp. TaxID=40001 RepID=UPI00178F1E86|nr:HAD-IA family hydrolase [Cellulomonas sp.]NMM18076.1 HAD-IA family hydrolase [Cellulomonas sp.]NMM31798.1 HAD-IA family hydrolase [Cellulomonas sp.]
MELITEAIGGRLDRPGAGLLIDLDGTLVRSEAAHQGAFRQYFASRGWEVDDDVIRGFSGRRAHEVFASVVGPWGDEDPVALTRSIIEVLREMDVRPDPVAGAARLLAACVTTGLPVCVVTSAGREWTAAVLRSLGVVDGDAGLVTAEDCAHGKPDPEPFRRGVELLGLPPSGLVALEDTPAGIVSARTAGVGHVVGVTTSHPADVLVTAGAGQTVADLTTVADMVEGRRHTSPIRRAERQA